MATKGLPRKPELGHDQRIAISELLSIAKLSTDLNTHDLIVSRIDELFAGSRPWLLTDESARAELKGLIAGWEKQMGELNRDRVWHFGDQGVDLQ
jgi:hypothetical protein